MKTFSIHLPDGTRKTLCGKSRQQITIRGVAYWRVRVLEIIKPSQSVDEATCKACHRVEREVDLISVRAATPPGHTG